MSAVDPNRFYPNIYVSKVHVDQAYNPTGVHYRPPYVADGSRYNVYDIEGRINKALPLTMRPVVGYTFPGAKGVWGVRYVRKGDVLKRK